MRKISKNIKKYEKNQKIEKEKEDLIEKENLAMRKERNKMRLQKEINQPPKKRIKTDDTENVSIRDIWGRPPPSAPSKNNNESKEKEEEPETERRKIEPAERLINIVTLENKVTEGKTITEFDIETRDWEKGLKEHVDRVEKETSMRKKQLKKKKEFKEKRWQLYRECKRFLEENDKNWEKEKKKEIWKERDRKDYKQVESNKRN